MLERHEQFLSQRGNLCSDSMRQSTWRKPISAKKKKKVLPRRMMPSPQTTHRKGDNAPDHETTPLLREKQQQLPKESSSSLGAPPAPATARNNSAYASSESSVSLSPPTATSSGLKREECAPSRKNPHWEKIKENIDQGNFLVKEVLSTESELLESHAGGVDSEKTQTSSKSVETLRQEAIENFQRGSTFSPQLCLLAIALYMVISVFMFCFFLEPQWTVIDSCYFAVSTFTTLGYGDLAPTSTMSVIFTTVYALAGVACLGLALGIIGNGLLETKENSQWHENFAQEYEALTMFDRMGDSSYQYDSDSECGYFEPVDAAETSSGSSSSSEEPMTVDDLVQSSSSGESASENDKVDQKSDKAVRFCNSVKESSSAENEIKDNANNTQALSSIGDSSFSSKRDYRQSAKNIDKRTLYNVNLRRFLVLLIIALIFAFLIGRSSGWTCWDTFYFAVVTAATIGT
jgi:hypothetical protein